jgi:hypothetical protein
MACVKALIKIKVWGAVSRWSSVASSGPAATTAALVLGLVVYVLLRPLGFQQQWEVIRSRPDDVLGGLAYTWASNGPEDLDRVFGLVDPSGVPTDGAALSADYLTDGAVVVDAPVSN